MKQNCGSDCSLIVVSLTTENNRIIHIRKAVVSLFCCKHSAISCRMSRGLPMCSMEVSSSLGVVWLSRMSLDPKRPPHSFLCVQWKYQAVLGYSFLYVQWSWQWSLRQLSFWPCRNTPPPPPPPGMDGVTVCLMLTMSEPEPLSTYVGNLLPPSFSFHLSAQLAGLLF